MISTESLTSDWIDQVAEKYNYPDKPLLEKSVRALYLLEALVKEGCPLIFKGGSSLLLLLKDSLHRLSIDVDIICPPGTDIEKYLDKISSHGFTRVVPTGTAQTRNNLPVSHSKVYFEVEYKTNTSEGFIKLDVLYEDNPYSNITSLPIEHRILKREGEPVMVNLPSLEDMLGDKITAFGPESIGIPYFKGDRDCSLEIMKQLFDNGRLFESVSDFRPVYESFRNVSAIELGYRGLEGQISKYYEDVRGTAISICSRGRVGTGNFTMLQQGIIKLKPFMYQRSYMIQDAIVDAARVAYLATCFEKGITNIEKYNPETGIDPALKIEAPFPAALSRLKAISPEAFYYIAKASEIIR